MSEGLNNLRRLEFYEGSGEPSQEGVLPVRREAEYLVEEGEFSGTRLLFSLSANESVPDEVLDRYGEELQFFCILHPVVERENLEEQAYLVNLLNEALELANSWDSEKGLTNLLRYHLEEALVLARHEAREEGFGEETVNADDGFDNVVVIDFEVHPEDQGFFVDPVYLEFDIDPTISPGDPDHSYPVATPEAVYQVNTNGGTVNAGFGSPTRNVGIYAQNINANFLSGCFRVQGVTVNTQYRIRGGMVVDYSNLPQRAC